ncbi:hypothetical protein CR513_22559, partial [Mucuna pruriens]
MDDIRKGIIEPCESLYDLKRLMRKIFVPSSYEGSPKVISRFQEYEGVPQGNDVVELQTYGTLAKLVHQEVKLRRRSASRRLTICSSSWRGRDREKEKVKSDRSPKRGSETFQGLRR